MSESTDRNNAFYAPLFGQFAAQVDADALRVETACLAFELRQVPHLPSAALVLDAGCGTGRYAAAWRRLFPQARLVGVDVNRAILAGGQVDPQALQPVNGNLESLPFRDGAFDVVMSRGVIQHTADPRQALRELLRVCRPGGLLYFYTYRFGANDVALGAARRVAAALGQARVTRAVYAACRAARLDPRAATMIVDELFVPIRFAFREATIRAWLAGSGAAIAAIQPVRHAQFGDIELPIDRRTQRIYRWVPKNGLITLAVRLGTAPADDAAP
ncbi:MAG: methyltransferase domain-containing protein [Deltaproteobacteria bacterium]|nr:methyltransferase domain-containing protein [Deltaproteobacteria bacterium]